MSKIKKAGPRKPLTQAAIVRQMQVDFGIGKNTATRRVKDSFPQPDMVLGPKRFWRVETYARWKEGLCHAQA